MKHRKEKLSIGFFVYSFMVFLAMSKLGSWFFKKTYNKINSRSSNDRWFKLWWHFRLLNYAKNMDLSKIDVEKMPKRKVVWINQYHYAFYNVAFHGSIISAILYELANGRIPVVKDELDVWSWFFEQPFGTDEITDEKDSDIHAILCAPKYMHLNKRIKKSFSKVYVEFSKFNKTAKEYVENEVKEVLGDKKVLGVVCRGTDYIHLRPKGHPKQPDINVMIKKVKSWMEKYKFDAIYVATEDGRLFQKFEEAFPGKILSNKRHYFDKSYEENLKKGIEGISDVHFDRQDDNWYKGLEYLSSMYIVSKCTSLVAGGCGGTGLAVFLNDNKYDKLHIFDCGVY